MKIIWVSSPKQFSMQTSFPQRLFSLQMIGRETFNILKVTSASWRTGYDIISNPSSFCVAVILQNILSLYWPWWLFSHPPSGRRGGLCQIPEERVGAQVQQASVGAAIQLQKLLGENLRWTQAPPGVQPWAVQGAAEIRRRRGDLLHGFRDGRGKRVLLGGREALGGRLTQCLLTDGGGVPPWDQRAVL